MEGRIINTATQAPDQFWDADYHECSYDTIGEAMEDCDTGTVVELDTMYKGPTVYGVVLGKNWNDENEMWDEFETKTFHNRAEAELAAETNAAEERSFSERDERQKHLDWLKKHPEPHNDYITFGTSGFGGGGYTTSGIFFD